MELLKTILNLYDLNAGSVHAEAIGSGLIHRSWKIIIDQRQFVLQQINEQVFQCPGDIMHNIGLIGDYLQNQSPGYLFIRPVIASNGSNYVQLKDQGYYRLFPFVKDSCSGEVVSDSQMAYEAAKQFGQFSSLLSGFDSSRLRITIPCFHDLSLRYQQLLSAIEQAEQVRLKLSASLIKKLVSHVEIVNQYQQIRQSREFGIRTTHHDTKISNVLFDQNGKGLCVIDLDTVMPGYFISDVGDMMRSYLPLHGEDEHTLQLLEIREDIYRAIVQGYGEAMKDLLTETENNSFFYAGKFMIYMQSIRFLTDYLQQNRYYGEAYPEQNYIRAQNQLVLLERLIEKQSLLQRFRP